MKLALRFVNTCAGIGRSPEGNSIRLVDKETGEVVGVVQRIHQQQGITAEYPEEIGSSVKYTPNGKYQADLLISVPALGPLSGDNVEIQKEPLPPDSPFAKFVDDDPASRTTLEWDLAPVDPEWVPHWGRSIMAVTEKKAPQAFFARGPFGETHEIGKDIRAFFFTVSAEFTAPFGPTESMKQRLLHFVTDLFMKGVNVDENHWFYAHTQDLSSDVRGNVIHVFGGGQMSVRGYSDDTVVEELTLRYGAMDVTVDGILVEVVPGNISIKLSEKPNPGKQPADYEKAKERLESWCSGGSIVVPDGVGLIDTNLYLLQNALRSYPDQKSVLEAMRRYVLDGGIPLELRNELEELVKNARAGKKEETP